MASLTQDIARRSLSSSIEIKNLLLNDDNIITLITEIGGRCAKTIMQGNRIILAGNGGSAADAQHIAAEFVSRFELERPGMPALSLATDTSMLTAIGNDYGYEYVFSRQLQANGTSGDVFIGISTSGNSKNVILALEEARNCGMVTVGLTGQSGGNMSPLCDYCLQVPSEKTARIQEAHITIGHIICEIAELTVFGTF